MAGSPKHKPDARNRQLVETLAGMGISQADMCQIIGIGSKNTLEKYYRKELDSGMPKARGRVARNFFRIASEGDDWRAAARWLRMFGGDAFKEVDQEQVSMETKISLDFVDMLVKASEGDD